jgi:hypothetical protein
VYRRDTVYFNLEGSETFMEDVKIKISALWIFRTFSSIIYAFMMLMEEGIIEEIIAREFLGMKIGPEILLAGAIESWIPMVMIVLSLTLKKKANRWLNIIVGIVFTVLSLISIVDALTAHGILMWVSAAVATALIFWYAWKWQ